jgi:uncharacterized phage-associated protein
MANVHDVAAYILRKRGEMSAMKLQKLAYYCQAWSLVWDDRPLFPEPIEAWVNGPVIPALYDQHRGVFSVREWPRGNADDLTAAEKETVDVVLRGYGDKNAQELADLTHREMPWLNARRGLPAMERGNRAIPLESMQEFYAALPV